MTTQTESEAVAQKFFDAVRANDATLYEQVLTKDAGLRLYRWDGFEGHRPRPRVIERLTTEWAGWRDPTLTIHTLTAMEDGRIVVELRIQATEEGIYVEHNRAAFLTVQGEQVAIVDLYCPLPIPSAHRTGYIAPADLSDDELRRLFQESILNFDVRRPLPLQVSLRINARAMQFLSGLPEPTSNYFGFANWSEDEADAKIQAVIDQCREQGIGFQWVVGPLDTPADLGKRLERHGMMLAGGYSTMARKGLDADDIPTNPDLVIEAIDREHPERVADAVNVMAVCFHMPAAQAELEQRGWLARFEEPGFFERARAFVAYLHGQPVGVGRMELSGGRAYLGGAATLPEVRGKKIYSTLLRRRLQDAQARGYHVAVIDAGPMSRRVVERYGFQEYAALKVYGWMPVMDPAVIHSLVPDE